MTLPTLYKTTKTGATQVCIISTLANCVTTEWGQLNGAMQTKNDIIHEGKNLGKANATTKVEQAEAEAKSKWAKKVKSGYSESIEAPTTVQLPMKVKVWPGGKLPPKVVLNADNPLYSTPKLNGVCALYKRDVVDGTLMLISRGGDLYPPIPHLEEGIITAMECLGSDELNVEIYKHGEHLQDITGAVKKPRELSASLEAHIFDIADSDEPYKARRDIMNVKDIMMGGTLAGMGIHFLCGVVVSTTSEIESHYNQCMASGLEGTVIKHPEAMYEHNVRSNRMWKYKKMKDKEFQVVMHNIDKNGHAVYVCQTPEGRNFSVKRKGTTEERLADAAVASSKLSKWLTVYFETYSKDGIPLKPVGGDFRDCDIHGNPLT